MGVSRLHSVAECRQCEEKKTEKKNHTTGSGRNDITNKLINGLPKKRSRRERREGGGRGGGTEREEGGVQISS